MYVYIYIYIYVCVCVCVCVCVRATYGTSVAMLFWSVFCLYVRCDIYGRVMIMYSISAVFAHPPLDTQTTVFDLHPVAKENRDFLPYFYAFPSI